VLIATKDVIVGKVAKNASNSFVYFVMTISKLMLKLLMFFALIFILIFLLLNLDDDFLSVPLILNLEVSLIGYQHDIIIDFFFLIIYAKLIDKTVVKLKKLDIT
jgi:hypothetical protein